MAPQGSAPQGSAPHSTFFGMRTHHVVIALIAIVIAVALASNYYLW